MTESAAQVFARLGGREPLGDIDLPFLSPLNSGHGVKGGDTIEVWGEEGSGKSELLLNIATQCAIPKHWKGVWLGGRGQQCVLISTDYKVDLLRLEAIIEGQLRQRAATSIRSSSCQLLDNTKQLLTDTLNRIHVLYCSSSHQLTATLHYMREFTHNNPELSVILLDNVGAFYWSDRADTFRHNSDTPATGAKHNNWIRTLQELVKDRHLVLFAARPVLFTRRPDQAASDSFLGPAWQRMIKHSFNVQKYAASEAASTSVIEDSWFEIKRTSGEQTHKFTVTKNGVVFVQ